MAVHRITYWLDLFTGKTWEEFLAAGARVTGFRESRWRTLQKVKPGDYFLCYLTGVSRFVGVLEVTSQAFKDTSPIWEDESFPCRAHVKVIATLEPETAVPIHALRDRLSIFENLKSPHAWTGRVRGSPARWNVRDGQAVLEAVLEAVDNPVVRPVDARKLARRPRAIRTRIGPVTVPEDKPTATLDTPIEVAETTEHTRMQYLLLKLGTEMGFDVRVAQNDLNREVDGKRLSDLFRLRTKVPVQFDEATTKTIGLIDVLWLKGKSIVAAFEVERTTAVYSGLLRMSDLLAMQPNLSIPLYLVAPDERRQKVFTEVNRPTFALLSPPLADVCRYISFETLQEKHKKVEAILRYLKPEFLDELSEECQLEEP